MSAAKRPLVAVICAVGIVLSGAALTLGVSGPAPASAAAAATPDGHDPLGQALMTAAKATGVLDAIEGSLVYLGAKYEGTTTAEKVARQSTEPQAATFGGSTPVARCRCRRRPPVPTARQVPPPPGGRDEPLVARIPATPNSYGDPTATYVSGIALSPPEAPERVAGAINAANTIVGRPYVWGGGHGSWYDRGYDCSGAVSFALAGGGFLSTPLASGQLEPRGARPGPGRWITDLRQRLPRLRRDRRPALGHRRRRPRQRPSLARRRHPARRLRRPPPARLLS